MSKLARIALLLLAMIFAGVPVALVLWGRGPSVGSVAAGASIERERGRGGESFGTRGELSPTSTPDLPVRGAAAADVLETGPLPGSSPEERVAAMPSTATVRVRVKLAGRKVPGAGVVLQSDDERQEGVTGRGGVASFLVTPNARYNVQATVRSKGWSARSSVVAPPAGEFKTTVIDLSQHDGGPSRIVTVLSFPSGAPIEGAQVTAFEVREGQRDKRRMRKSTDARGMAKMLDLDGLRYTVTARDHTKLPLTPGPGTEDHWTIELPAAARVHGQVPGVGSRGMIRLLPSRREQEWPRTSPIRRTDIEGGAWEITGIKVPHTTRKVGPFDVQFREGDAFRVLASGIELSAGDDVEIRDPLAGGAPVTLQLAYPNGNSVGRGVALRLLAPGEVNGRELVLLNTKTDEEGQAQVPSLPAGRYGMSVRLARGSGFYEIDATSDEPRSPPEAWYALPEFHHVGGDRLPISLVGLAALDGEIIGGDQDADLRIDVAPHPLGPTRGRVEDAKLRFPETTISAAGSYAARCRGNSTFRVGPLVAGASLRVTVYAFDDGDREAESVIYPYELLRTRARQTWLHDVTLGQEPIVLRIE